MPIYPKLCKPLFDRAAALVALLVLAPLFLALALAVKLSSPGPVFFRQRRMGLGGRPFTLLKFRSMRVDPAAEGLGFEPGGRSRITRIGGLLRKSKLDELPQILNVLRGEMSLVGPRPEVERYVQVYPERWKRVLRVKPGITDSASILYRDEEEILAAAADPEDAYRSVVMPRKLSLYESYAEKITLSGDLLILWRTFWVVCGTRRTPEPEPGKGGGDA